MESQKLLTDLIKEGLEARRFLPVEKIKANAEGKVPGPELRYTEVASP